MCPTAPLPRAGGTRPLPQNISTTLNTRGTMEVRKEGDRNVDTTPFSLFFLSIKFRSKQKEKKNKP